MNRRNSLTADARSRFSARFLGQAPSPSLRRSLRRTLRPLGLFPLFRGILAERPREREPESPWNGKRRAPDRSFSPWPTLAVPFAWRATRGEWGARRLYANAGRNRPLIPALRTNHRRSGHSVSPGIGPRVARSWRTSA